MIGLRLTPHHTHGAAVLIRVVAAMVFIGSLFVIPVSVAGAAVHHLTPEVAIGRVALAAALTLITAILARRFDPLRG